MRQATVQPIPTTTVPIHERPPLAQVLRQVIAAAPNERAKGRLIREALIARKDEITWTLAERTSDKFLRRHLHEVMLGQEQDVNTQRILTIHPPLHESIQLQSLLCIDGVYQPIVYQTDKHRLDNRELKDLILTRGPGANEINVLCEVDPKTGMFLKRLAPIEALKCLREHGEQFARPRWKRVGTGCLYGGRPCPETKPHAHDQWIVRDVMHAQVYGAPDAAAVQRGPARTVVSASAPMRMLSAEEMSKVRSPEEAEQARRE